MASYILHIGYGKTGTTALQHFFAHNRRQLRAAGVLYPDIHARGGWLNVESHNLLGQVLVGKGGHYGLSPEAIIDQIEEQRRAAGVERVLLSGEMLLGAPHPWTLPTEAAHRAAHRDKVDRLHELLGEHRVEVLVYLRRQDHWLESSFNQTVKYQGLMKGLDVDSAESYAALMAPRLDYADALAPWAEVFGTDRIQVGVFEPERLADGDILTDALGRLELGARGAFRDPPWDAESTNPGLSADVVAFKRVLNRVPRSKDEERFIAHALRIISSELPRSGSEDRGLLPPTFRRRLLTEYDASNREVARRYLGREDDPLFHEPWPETDGGEGHADGLTMEKGTELLLRLQQYRRSMAGRITWWRYRGGGILRRRLPWLQPFARMLRQSARRTVRKFREFRSESMQ